MKEEVGHGWVAAQAKAQSDKPASIVLEAGFRPTVDLGLYGDAWWQPGIGRAGVDVAARYKNNFDVYGSAWMDSHTGTTGAEIGAKWHF
jgi:hypothetical protein